MMTMKTKQELITQIVSLLGAMIAVEEEKQQLSMVKQTEPIEMLTIKECTEAVKGLSEHTVRQLIAQNKLPYIRTRREKHGKILIAKSVLLSYFGGAA